MNTQQNHVPQDAEKLKEIPKWTRRYAQNRTVPFLASMVIFLLLFTAIFGLSYLAGKANQLANVLALWICIFVVTVAMISLAFFCVPKWGGKFIERISRRLYNREGDVLISVPETIKKKLGVGYVVAMVFVNCVFISVILGLLGYLPIKYMQPVSALYVVPFLAFLYLWQRPIISPLVLLWPTLYSIHAILVVAGVPIQFGGSLVFLNMLVPVAGYGILCGLIGHIYSRYALKKLKTTAHLEENNKSQDQNTKQLKEIPKWTRRYAENRTLPFLVGMSTFLILFLGSSGLIYAAIKAYQSGNKLLFWVCLFADVLTITLVILAARYCERLLYLKEGYVTLALPKRTKSQQRAGMIAGLLFGVCLMISVILGVLGYIPIKYMQPVSAIYIVPFIIAIGFSQTPTVNPLGFLSWLWPTLYAIHAILIVAGVPIHFDRPWIFLNMLIPIAGYGILCALIGHFYSRYALKKLKTTAHLEENTNGQ